MLPCGKKRQESSSAPWGVIGSAFLHTKNVGAYQEQTAASRPGCPELKPCEVCTPQEQGWGGGTCLQPPERAQLQAGPRGLPTSKALSTAIAGTHHPTAALLSVLAACSSAFCSDFWAWAMSHSPAQHLSRETGTADPPRPALPAGLPPLLPSTHPPVLLSPRGRLHAPIPTATSLLSGASHCTALPAALILLRAQPAIAAPSSPAERQHTRDAKRPFGGQEDTVTVRLARSMCHLPSQHAAIPAGPAELLPREHNSPSSPTGCSQDRSSATGGGEKGETNREGCRMVTTLLPIGSVNPFRAPPAPLPPIHTQLGVQPGPPTGRAQ